MAGTRVSATPRTPAPTRTSPACCSAVSSGRAAGSSHNGGNAVDGNPGTRWSSAFADPRSVTVDLGSVRLQWETAYSRAYQIQLSDNNSTWRTGYSTTTSDGGVDEAEVNAAARYVRVHGTQRATQWGYSLWELAVLGS